MIPNSNKPDINWDIDKRVYIRENVISVELCDSIIEFGESNAIKGVNKYANVFDISFHACLLPIGHEVHYVLETIWEEIADQFQIDIDFVEPYEYKRYDTSDFFSKHTDNYYSLSIPLDRKLTMSIQLSDVNEYDGGELTVVNKKIKAPKGSIICFPSFFQHTVEKINSGTRKSLIGWAWGPYWK